MVSCVKCQSSSSGCRGVWQAGCLGGVWSIPLDTKKGPSLSDFSTRRHKVNVGVNDGFHVCSSSEIHTPTAVCTHVCTEDARATPATPVRPCGRVNPSFHGSFRSQLTFNCDTHTGSFISPELGEALNSIKGVVAAFERDIRSDVKWDSALV